MLQYFHIWTHLYLQEHKSIIQCHVKIFWRPGINNTFKKNCYTRNTFSYINYRVQMLRCKKFRLNSKSLLNGGFIKNVLQLRIIYIKWNLRELMNVMITITFMRFMIKYQLISLGTSLTWSFVVHLSVRRMMCAVDSIHCGVLTCVKC